MLKCRSCEIEKPEDDFYRGKSGTPYRTCKKCHSSYVSRHQLRNLNHRSNQLKQKYGITAKDFDVMIEEQGGKCAICFSGSGSRSKQTPLHIDHNHETGKVRGLVCHRCNVNLLGKSTEMIPVLKRAIDYLERNT